MLQNMFKKIKMLFQSQNFEIVMVLLKIQMEL